MASGYWSHSPAPRLSSLIYKIKIIITLASGDHLEIKWDKAHGIHSLVLGTEKNLIIVTIYLTNFIGNLFHISVIQRLVRLYFN